MSTRRDDILIAATEIVAERGFDALAYRTVDNRAGLPLGSTSNVFKTKHELVAAVVRRGIAGGEMPPRLLFTGAVQDEDSLVDALIEGFRYYFTGGMATWVARNRAVHEGRDRPDLRAELGALYAVTVSELQAALAAAGCPAPEERVLMLIAYLDGVLLHQHVRGRFHGVTDRMVRPFVRALLAPDTPEEGDRRG